MLGPQWAQYLVAASTTLAAVSYVYRKWLHPTVSALISLGHKIGVLDEIANEFRPNHGSTLRDTIDKMDLRLAEHVVRVRVTHDELTATLNGTVTSLHAHMDDDKGQFARSSAALIAGQQSLDVRLAAIEAQLNLARVTADDRDTRDHGPTT